MTGPEPDTTPDTGGRGREAARYRVALRAAEAERDTLAAQVEQARRAEVERVAAASLADPTDLWRGTTVADVLTDDGTVDPERVGQAVTEVLTAHPHWAAARPSGPSVEGGARSTAAKPVTFGDVIRAATRSQ